MTRRHKEPIEESFISSLIRTGSKVFERSLSVKQTQNEYFPDPEYDEPASAKWVFYPESGFKVSWDMLAFFLVMYQSFVIPYYIAFSTAPSWYYLTDIATTTIFTVDIAFTFNTAFYRRGAIITNREEIAKKYIKTWLWVDLIATFPYSWLIEGRSAFTNNNDISSNSGNILYTGPSFLRILKLTRMVSLLRIAKFRKKLRELEYIMSSNQLSTLIMAFKLLIMMISVSHWIACLWIFISYDDYGTYQTWIVQARLSNDSMLDIYISAMYWSIASMASVGYGDIMAVSPTEKAIAILCMVIGSGIFTYIISNIGTLVAKQTSDSKQHRERVVKFNSFMKYNDIPSDLKFKVRRYMDYIWEKRQVRVLHENDFLELLSEPLRDAIFYHTRGKVMKSCSILHTVCVGQVIVQMARIFEPRVYAPSDVIFEEGERNCEMHFILQGQIEVLHRNTRTVFKILSGGDYFGQISFFAQHPRKASVHCLEFVEVLTLVRQKVDVLVERYPDVALSLSMIKQRCEDGDLSELEIVCYVCGELGHAAVDCRRYVINANAEENGAKWLKAREEKTVLVNPFSLVQEPNFIRKPKQLKLDHFLSAVAESRSPVRKFDSDMSSPRRRALRRPTARKAESGAESDFTSRLDIILSEDESSDSEAEVLVES